MIWCFLGGVILGCILMLVGALLFFRGGRYD